MLELQSAMATMRNLVMVTSVMIWIGALAPLVLVIGTTLSKCITGDAEVFKKNCNQFCEDAQDFLANYKQFN